MLRVDLPSVVTSRLFDHLSAAHVPLTDVDLALAQLLQACSVLPVEAVRKMLSFRSNPHAPGAMLVTGIPIDSNLPATPIESSGPPYKTGNVSERAILLFAVLLG